MNFAIWLTKLFWFLPRVLFLACIWGTWLLLSCAIGAKVVTLYKPASFDKTLDLWTAAGLGRAAFEFDTCSEFRSSTIGLNLNEFASFCSIGNGSVALTPLGLQFIDFRSFSLALVGAICLYLLLPVDDGLFCTATGLRVEDECIMASRRDACCIC